VLRNWKGIPYTGFALQRNPICHHLDKNIPEDLAITWTDAVQSVLHDTGNELCRGDCRADVVHREQDEDLYGTAGDSPMCGNGRVERYNPKDTINP